VRESIIAQAAHTSHSQVTPEEKIPLGAMHLSVGTKGAAAAAAWPACDNKWPNNACAHSPPPKHLSIYTLIF